MSTTSGLLTAGDLHFALPHAVNIAEAGRTLQEKRIGIFFADPLLALY